MIFLYIVMCISFVGFIFSLIGFGIVENKMRRLKKENDKLYKKLRDQYENSIKSHFMRLEWDKDTTKCEEKEK